MAGKAKPRVTERELLRRINRKLAVKCCMVRQWRTSGSNDLWTWHTGDYFLFDVERQAVVDGNLPLEALGREMDVLGPWEKLTE